MPPADYLFTSESVAEGHPDKVCDRISDEIVDVFFREASKNGFAAKDLRVACETMATTNRVTFTFMTASGGSLAGWMWNECSGLKAGRRIAN